MLVYKKLNEVRKFEKFHNGNRDITYIKYDCTLAVLKKTEKSALVRMIVTSSALHNTYLPWEPFPDTQYVWSDPSVIDKELWIPLSCIQGDVENDDSFMISDWFCKKKEHETLLFFVPYAERCHQWYYKVLMTEKVEESVVKLNAEAKAKYSK